jgi:O-6-methylguanine DNA methyltransferase
MTRTQPTPAWHVFLVPPGTPCPGSVVQAEWGNSPWGLLIFRVWQDRLVGVYGDRDTASLASLPPGCTGLVHDPDKIRPFFEALVRQSGAPVKAQAAGTPFQHAVWRTLAAQPRGSLLTYSTLARLAGFPGAARAVGQAMACNPLPLIIPCHQVVRSGGDSDPKAQANFQWGLHRKKELQATLLPLDVVVQS